MSKLYLKKNSTKKRRKSYILSRILYDFAVIILDILIFCIYLFILPEVVSFYLKIIKLFRLQKKCDKINLKLNIWIRWWIWSPLHPHTPSPAKKPRLILKMMQMQIHVWNLCIHEIHEIHVWNSKINKVNKKPQIITEKFSGNSLQK